MKIYFEDHGDPSVGIYVRTYTVEFHDVKVEDLEDRDGFRNDLCNLIASYINGDMEGGIFEDENGVCPPEDEPPCKSGSTAERE